MTCFRSLLFSFLNSLLSKYVSEKFARALGLQFPRKLPQYSGPKVGIRFHLSSFIAFNVFKHNYSTALNSQPRRHTQKALVIIRRYSWWTYVAADHKKIQFGIINTPLCHPKPRFSPGKTLFRRQCKCIWVRTKYTKPYYQSISQCTTNPIYFPSLTPRHPPLPNNSKTKKSPKIQPQRSNF